MALLHIKNFSCHVTLATFKKKTSTCGSQVDHMWAHPDYSVGQMGQQVQPTFNPDACIRICTGKSTYIYLFIYLFIYLLMFYNISEITITIWLVASRSLEYSYTLS